MKLWRITLEFRGMPDDVATETLGLLCDEYEPDDAWAQTSHELEGGEVLSATHPEKTCAGEHCTVHNPSDHHMRSMPQHWRSDRQIMERICDHGIGHPDPDEINPDGVHGCDGCCRRPS